MEEINPLPPVSSDNVAILLGAYNDRLLNQLGIPPLNPVPGDIAPQRLNEIDAEIAKTVVRVMQVFGVCAGIDEYRKMQEAIKVATYPLVLRKVHIIENSSE